MLGLSLAFTLSQDQTLIYFFQYFFICKILKIFTYNLALQVSYSIAHFLRVNYSTTTFISMGKNLGYP